MKKRISKITAVILAISAASGICSQGNILNASESTGIVYQTNYEVAYETNVLSYKGKDLYLEIEAKIDNNSVKSIFSNAFLDNDTLLEVKIGKGIEVINSSAFKNCSMLKKIFIPESIKKIKENAFIDYAKEFSIVGYVGSEAQRYALENDIPFILMGDIDKSGKQTVVDLLKFKKYFLNLEKLDEESEKISDMNMDGELNILDMVGLINSVLIDKPNATPSVSKTALAKPDFKNLSENGTYIENEITGLVDFVALSTSKILLDEDQIGKNSAYSPTSYYMALSAVTEFSEGNTKSEFLNVLHATDLEMLRTNNTNLFKGSYINNDKQYCLFANSLWLNNINGIKYNQKVLDILSNDYFVSSFSEDFSNEATGPKIAKWITENTGGKIENIEVKASPEDVLKLVNTINFENQWINKFVDTKKDIFYLADKSTVEADFMKNHVIEGDAVINEKYTKASLEMQKGCKMTFVLPNENFSVEEILKDEEMLKNILTSNDKSQKAEITYHVPKFDIDSKFDLIKTANSLGIYDAIDENFANFKYVSEDPERSKGIFMSDAIQEATLKIDEDGCAAAAYTIITLSENALPTSPELKLDLVLNRPFIYYVTDRNNSTLFIGTVYNPVE